MATKQASKEAVKKQKTQTRQTIAEELDHVWGKYKNGTAKKKYEKGLKKASKALSKIVVVPAPKKLQPKKSCGAFFYFALGRQNFFAFGNQHFYY